jgi:IS605 OrfB family transposase
MMAKKKQFKFKKRKNNINKMQILQSKVAEHNEQFNDPLILKYDNIKTSSWFDIKNANMVSNNLFNSSEIKITGDKIENDGYYTEEILLNPTKLQKRILIHWSNCYIRMYNYTTKYFKHCRFYGETVDFSIGKLKSILSEEKNIVYKWSKIMVKNINKQKPVYVDRHLLDYAINDALARYKSCLSNLKAGNIKYFRLRYLKFTKPNKIFKIEPLAFNNNGFYTNTLGKVMECQYKDFNYEQYIKNMSTLHYNAVTDKFKLLVKHKFTKGESNNKNIVAIDLGIRTALTCYANNGVHEIGTISSNKIRRRLKIIDSINNNDKLSVKKKQYAVEKRREHLKNLMKDFHWKTIKFLTDNYGTILIGNFSTKSMGETNTVSDMTKRIGNTYSFYKFTQKLQYICYKLGIKYKLVDEAYTSKCCGRCGNYKKDLGSNKIYNCIKCGTIIDRDIGSAKTIAILGIY